MLGPGPCLLEWVTKLCPFWSEALLTWAPLGSGTKMGLTPLMSPQEGGDSVSAIRLLWSRWKRIHDTDKKAMIPRRLNVILTKGQFPLLVVFFMPFLFPKSLCTSSKVNACTTLCLHLFCSSCCLDLVYPSLQVPGLISFAVVLIGFPLFPFTPKKYSQSISPCFRGKVLNFGKK